MTACLHYLSTLPSPVQLIKHSPGPVTGKSGRCDLTGSLRSASFTFFLFLNRFSRNIGSECAKKTKNNIELLNYFIPFNRQHTLGIWCFLPDSPHRPTPPPPAANLVPRVLSYPMVTGRREHWERGCSPS